MRVLVLGAGATGGYYGGRMIEAGMDVSFLVRPKRAALLADHGLRVTSARGDIGVPVKPLVEVPRGARFDLVLLSCKAYDLDSAIASIAPAVGESTRVLPLLNGLRHLDALDAAFGRERVLGGLCHISATLADDGTIRQFGALERLTFGARGADPLFAAIATEMAKVRSDIVESADVIGSMWEKFAFLTSLAALTCMMRASVGEVVSQPGGAALAMRLYTECVETARRSQHTPGERAQAEAERLLGDRSSPIKASMLRDIERGARTECEHILGDMLSRARECEVDAPILQAACTHVRVYELQRTRAPVV